MCYRDRANADSVLIDLVNELVSEWVYNRKHFSAYDVTTVLRAENPDKNIRHNDVREIVRDMYADCEMDGVYISSNYTLPSGIVTIVYHPDYYDAELYDCNFAKDLALRIINIPAPAVPAAPAAPADSTNSVKEIMDNFRNGLFEAILDKMDGMLSDEEKAEMEKVVKFIASSEKVNTALENALVVIQDTLMDALEGSMIGGNPVPADVSNPWAKAPDSTVSAPAVAMPTPTDSEVRGYDSRGRLCIPNYMISALGLVSGDEVGVWIGKGTLTVNKKGGTPDVIYVVDASGNVRIGVMTLDKACLNDSSATITRIGNSITVS